MFAGGDLSQATLTSGTADLDGMQGYSVQCTFTGTATGTLTLQGSDDPVAEPNLSRIVNWTDTSSAQALAAPGSILFNVSDVQYKWVRLVYAKTAGTGAITANLHAKGF